MESMERTFLLIKKTINLREADDLAGIKINVDIKEARTRAETRHCLHLTDERIDETGTNTGTDITDRKNEATWSTLYSRIM